ncbi:hypothetical protein BKP35_06250 [Anaerobacillus arseniciselenatis]|uniref:Uncharacterized protein n=1 Tax=Anaerobacillus arseniciselenatis TaxID=85682 RepID=A0A1S2LQ55_9BACI|nr:hypothetical protein BKP35_06250 [Anaerobacillus arseniciselenatis]
MFFAANKLKWRLAFSFLIATINRHDEFCMKKADDFVNEPLRFDRRSQRREGNHSPFSILDLSCSFLYKNVFSVHNNITRKLKLEESLWIKI